MGSVRVRGARMAVWQIIVATLLGATTMSAALACGGGPIIDVTNGCKHETSTTITSLRNPSLLGQTASFDIVVATTDGSRLQGGSLEIRQGSNLLDTITVASPPNGTFTISVAYSTLAVGTQTISAKFVPGPQSPTTIGSIGKVVQWVSATCRVMQNAAGANTGLAWADAFADLQSALALPGCREIWVAGGTYTPSTTGDITGRFNISPGVGVYGGFAGTESQHGQRDARANPTILSGDLGGGAHSYHVVWMDGNTAAGKIDADTVLDGLTITGGNANGTGRDDRGAGLTCAGDGIGHGCSPSLRNLRFTGNRARFGGAMLLEGSNGGDSSPTITNTTFDHNTAASNGGAVYNSGYAGSSYPTYANVTFFANEASGTYAGSGYGGAAFNDFRNNGNGNPAFFNVTFSGNRAAAAAGGGAIYSMCGAPVTIGGLAFINSIAWNDTAAGAVNEIASDCTSILTLDHSIVAGGCPHLGACTNLLSTDPLLGPLQDNGGSTPTLQPGSAGSAIGNGDSGVCAATPVNGMDQRGAARPQLSANCDIGALELTDRIFKYDFE